MTQSLSINGKEYVPTNVLASQCGYSSDYISRLAREEKVLGTQIGRQWFVEPESLKTCLSQINFQKQIRQEELRRKRKIEHEFHQRKVASKTHEATEIGATAQALIVVLCGGLLGGLGWVSAHEDLGLSELSVGVQENFALIESAIIPDVALLLGSRQDQVASSAEGIEVLQQPLVYTVLPQFPERAPIHAVPFDESEVEAQFSDEVVVTVAEDGSYVIQPVFRGGEGSPAFLVVPLHDHE